MSGAPRPPRPRPRSMGAPLAIALAAVMGLALATVVIGLFGLSSVLAALAQIGWRGFAFLTVYSVFPFALLGTAWFVLSPGAPLRQWGVFIWARTMRDSATEVLPFSPFGGFVIGARTAILHGVAPVAAFSTTVVDVTTELIAQLGFAGFGLAMLALRLGAGSARGGLLGAGLLGLLLSAAGAAAFIVVQRRGMGLVEGLARRFLPAAVAGAGAVGRALNALYERPLRLGAAVAIHLAAWIASAAGAWGALRLAGVDIGLADVLAIEALVTAVRSAAFVAPMGVGVQEATYALVGPLFGLPAEMSLA
ncbi:MAG: lysylphosphatidylglycerol synthase domain-containing protein, partial [Caulobacteraceae bacterium]